MSEHRTIGEQEVRWYALNLRPIRFRHASTDGRTALCGWPVGSNSLDVTVSQRRKCADCVRRLHELNDQGSDRVDGR